MMNSCEGLIMIGKLIQMRKVGLRHPKAPEDQSLRQMKIVGCYVKIGGCAALLWESLRIQHHLRINVSV